VSAREHADRWLAAWNAHDLDAIMAGYAEDVEFVASTVVGRWGRPDGRLVGRADLRRHFALGLELVPQLTMVEEQLLTAPDGYALLYVRENGNRALDAVQLDPAGRARRVHAYYLHEQR
jgi:ketosteroid isomerase-like protein